MQNIYISFKPNLVKPTSRIFAFVKFCVTQIWETHKTGKKAYLTKPFQHCSTVSCSGFLKCVTGRPPSSFPSRFPANKKQVISGVFPKACRNVMPNSISFEFYLSYGAFLGGLKTEVLLHSVNPPGVWRHVTMQYTDASCDLEKQPWLCKALIFGGSKMLQPGMQSQRWWLDWILFARPLEEHYYLFSADAILSQDSLWFSYEFRLLCASNVQMVRCVVTKWFQLVGLA